MRLDVGWFRIDWINDQGKPMLAKSYGCLRTCKEYPEMMFPVMRDETSNGSVQMKAVVVNEQGENNVFEIIGALSLELR
jgi:hypothetical protein